MTGAFAFTGRQCDDVTMDDNASQTPSAAVPSEDAVFQVDDVEVAAFSAVVERLRVRYPQVAVPRIETVLLREWEAFSAGRPLVVPTAVEAGVHEILGGAPTHS